MTSTEIHAATGEVLHEVGVQIDLLDQQASTYVSAYLKHTMFGARRPTAPAGMHPQIAAALRELALDEATTLRLYGRRRETV